MGPCAAPVRGRCVWVSTGSVTLAQKGLLPGAPQAAPRSPPGRTALFRQAGKEKFLISPGKHSMVVPQLPGPRFYYKGQVHLSDTRDQCGRGGGEGRHFAKQLF